jgi:hypothetical protein
MKTLPNPIAPNSLGKVEPQIWRIMLCFILALQMLAHFPEQTIFAAAPDNRSARQTARVKAAVAAIGAGQSAHVSVELKDKTKITGTISAIGEDNFVVIDSKSNASVTISYATVKKFKGQNPSVGKTIALGMAGHLSPKALIILVGLLIVVVVLVASDKS